MISSPSIAVYVQQYVTRTKAQPYHTHNTPLPMPRKVESFFGTRLIETLPLTPLQQLGAFVATPDYELRRIVQECFDGTRYRSCQTCAAYHKNGGICCFGHRYEDNDDSCRSCQYTFPCRQETMVWSSQSRNPHVFRPSNSSNHVPISKSSSREPLLKEKAHVVSSENDDDGKSFAKQLGMRALWGAVEGALEMVLNFFRTKRPF